jgi:hypothetical protein
MVNVARRALYLVAAITVSGAGVGAGLGTAAAADFPSGYDRAPPPRVEYGPPVEEEYVYRSPPAVYVQPPTVYVRPPRDEYYTEYEVAPRPPVAVPDGYYRRGYYGPRYDGPRYGGPPRDGRTYGREEGRYRDDRRLWRDGRDRRWREGRSPERY